MPITIIGFGKTGRALAKYFAREGEDLWVVDDAKSIQKNKDSQSIKHWYLGGELPDFSQASRCFASPGIPPHHPAILKAKQAGLIIEEELDLAYSLCQGKLIAITGTNGKSTTTALLGEMLKADGKSTQVGGNFGTPFLELISDHPMADYYIIEVSSFQLDRIKKLRPHLAILLNISEDHLEWHQNFSEYRAAKAKLFAFQTTQDLAVYNAGDLNVLKMTESIAATKISFSNCQKINGAYVENKAYTDQNILHWAPQGKTLAQWDASLSPLSGIHNLENITAALAAAKALQVKDDSITQALKSFRGLAHRLEKVAEINGISFYDDSKATNVGAVAMSLASFQKNIILILGGVDKGGDYTPLKALIKAKVDATLVIGEAREKIKTALAGSGEIFSLPDMTAAVTKAKEIAKAGTSVLLSPACASFDQYKNYHERGEHFKELVKTLVKAPPEH